MRHSVLNAEAFTAVFFLLILLLRARPATHIAPEIQVSDRILYALLALVTLAAFWPALCMPLLHDSYGHVYTASRESFGSVLRAFVAHPQRGDFFFRPLGSVSFWIDGKWAGSSPACWHAWSVSVHILNSSLVYLLARRLHFGKAGAFMAAALFAIHGSRPEAVAWVAARFDLLAALFSLLALLCVLRYIETANRIWFGPLAAFTTAALLSKESAYCLPLLIIPIMLLSGSAKRITMPFAVVLLNCALVFSYRAWVLRGIGGYGAENGSPAILHFSLLRSLNALFFREWALLFFPVNWSVLPGPGLWAGIAANAAALLFVLVVAHASRSRLALTLAVTLSAALPVQHLLLIGSDLTGSRVLYLPALGMALFWACIIQDLQQRRTQLLAGALLLFFHLAALEHNLAIWGTTARLAQKSCEFLAGESVRDSAGITVRDVPPTWHGVYFLKNSLPACVLLNSGGALKQLPEINPERAANQRVYRWDNQSSGFRPVP